MFLVRFPVLSHLTGEGALKFGFFSLQFLGSRVVHVGHGLQFGHFVLQSVDLVLQLSLLVLDLGNEGAESNVSVSVSISI